MILIYDKYIELLSALNEHCKGTFPKNELQNTIFNHYAEQYDYFVAENINGSRLGLKVYSEVRKYKDERKKFRNHMNQELIVKCKNKKLY